jgi:hypothetical protein
MYKVLNVPIQEHEMHCVCAIGRKHSICRCDRHNVFLRIDVMLSENAKCNICPENRMVYICVTCILCFMLWIEWLLFAGIKHSMYVPCIETNLSMGMKHSMYVPWIKWFLFTGIKHMSHG